MRLARQSNLFFSHIAGLQKYMPAAMALFCANVNSYRACALPVGAHQCALGVRQPHGRPACSMSSADARL